jgi:hypothetical protein
MASAPPMGETAGSVTAWKKRRVLSSITIGTESVEDHLCGTIIYTVAFRQRFITLAHKNLHAVSDRLRLDPQPDPGK